MQDQIEAKKPTSLTELFNLREKIQEKEAEVQELKDMYGITDLETDILELQKIFDKGLASMAGSVIEWRPDPYLERNGWKGDSWREPSSGLKIILTPRTVREVKSLEFIKAFPLIAAGIASIPVGKAEKKLGADALEPYVIKKTTYSYELH